MRYKSILIAVCSIVLLIGCAGSLIPTVQQHQSLEKIQVMNGMTKDELYKKSLSWVARNYNSANDVIQLKDQENGQIICKGLALPLFYRTLF